MAVLYYSSISRSSSTNSAVAPLIGCYLSSAAPSRAKSPPASNHRGGWSSHSIYSSSGSTAVQYQSNVSVPTLAASALSSSALGAILQIPSPFSPPFYPRALLPLHPLPTPRVPTIAQTTTNNVVLNIIPSYNMYQVSYSYYTISNSTYTKETTKATSMTLIDTTVTH